MNHPKINQKWKSRSPTFSFSIKSTKLVLSISTGWPCRSYKARTKWKKLDFRRFEGGCFSKWARARPTPLRTHRRGGVGVITGVKESGRFILKKCFKKSLDIDFFLSLLWPWYLLTLKYIYILKKVCFFPLIPTLKKKCDTFLVAGGHAFSTFTCLS